MGAPPALASATLSRRRAGGVFLRRYPGCARAERVEDALLVNGQDEKENTKVTFLE